MNSLRRVLPFVALAGAVSGALYAWRAMQTTNLVEIATAAETAEWKKSEAVVRELERKVAAAVRERAALTAERDKVAAATKSAPPNSAPPSRPPSRPDSPEQQAKLTKEFRTKLRIEQQPFYRALKLSDSQIEQFENLLTEHDARRRDIQVTARAQRLSTKDPAIATLLAEEDRRFDGDFKTLLGEQAAREFTEFRAEAGDRLAVAELTRGLALTATPLTSEQGRQLAALFRDVGFQKRQADPAMWDELLQRGASVLSAPQLAELQALRTAKTELAFNQLQQIAQRSRK